MSDEFTPCEGCGHPIDPEAPDVIHGVEQIRADTPADSLPLDGFPVHFHQRCWRPSDRYRLT